MVSEQIFNGDMDRLVEQDLIRSEVIGLPAALIVLVIVFGALVAAGIPILLAIISILGAVGLPHCWSPPSPTCRSTRST